jgi:hypothetical protein
LRSKADDFEKEGHDYRLKLKSFGKGRRDYFYLDEGCEFNPHAGYYFVLLASRQDQFKISGEIELPSFYETPDEIISYGLVLTSIDHAAGVYRRVGLFEYENGSGLTLKGVRDRFSYVVETTITIV